MTRRCVECLAVLGASDLERRCPDTCVSGRPARPIPRDLAQAAARSEDGWRALAPPVACGADNCGGWLVPIYPAARTSREEACPRPLMDTVDIPEGRRRFDLVVGLGTDEQQGGRLARRAAQILLRALRRRAARVGGAQPFPGADSAAEFSLARLNVMTQTDRSRLSVYFGEARSETSFDVGRRTGAVHLHLRPGNTDPNVMRRWFRREDCPRSQSADLTGATTSIVLALQPATARDEGFRETIRSTADALARVFAPEAEHQAQPRPARGDAELFVLLIDDNARHLDSFGPRSARPNTSRPEQITREIVHGHVVGALILAPLLRPLTSRLAEPTALLAAPVSRGGLLSLEEEFTTAGVDDWAQRVMSHVRGS